MRPPWPLATRIGGEPASGASEFAASVPAAPSVLVVSPSTRSSTTIIAMQKPARTQWAGGSRRRLRAGSSLAPVTGSVGAAADPPEPRALTSDASLQDEVHPAH